MLRTTSKPFIAFLGVLAFVVAGNNAVALALWLWLKFAWWPLLAPSCLYTSSGLPAPPPQDYVINLIVFAPLSWLAWVFARRGDSATAVQTSPTADSAWQVLKPSAEALGVAAALYVILRYLCDFSLRQSVVLTLLGWFVFVLYLYLHALIVSQRSRTAFSPFKVFIEPKWHSLLSDLKLVNSEEEWHRLNQAIESLPASQYNVFRSPISFTVIAPPSDEGLPPGLTYWDNRQRFVSKVDFSEAIVEIESEISIRDINREHPFFKHPLFSGSLPSLCFRWGASGYELGLEVHARWWKRLCETGEIGELAKTKEDTDYECGTTRLVIATLPYSEFGIYYQKPDYLRMEAQQKARDKQLEAIGWKRKEERGPGWRVEHKYFKVSHWPV